MRFLLLLLSVSWISFFCTAQTQNWRIKTENADFIHRAIKQVTDVIVYDIYSPPVASRTYAYISVAGYEVIINNDPAYTSFAGQLHGLQPIPRAAQGKPYSFTLAAAEAILQVAKTLVISEDKIELFRAGILNEFKNDGIPEEVYNNSLAYGRQVANHIIKWASEDNYKQSRSLSKYPVADDDASWKPTPPAYIKAIEPHWNKIRTLVLDSAQQFKPLPSVRFSPADTSRFYKGAKEVYKVGLTLSDEQKAIANFWDCNPFKVNVRGHVMYATKKISPGGHWINITKLACEQTNSGIARSLEAYARVSVAIADAFISCWDEKYSSRVIRPETFINQYIDVSWVPLLQTPPFPEYTSGHSVVSAASAEILTNLFGENFRYTDSTENEFGLPSRNFHSFKEAAQEAAISRFYGGIHYMPAITNGMEQGKRLGYYVLSKIKTRRDR